MTDEQITAVKHVAVTPGQRLVIALTAVYAARAKAIRELTVDEIDLARRRLTIGGHQQYLTEFVHRTLVAWLRYRHRRWPHTPNRHILVSAQSALGTAPITDYYLTWHLLLRGVQLEQIRADRILQEALAVNADPLRLAIAFNLSPRCRPTVRRASCWCRSRPCRGVRPRGSRPSRTGTRSADEPAAGR